MPVELRAIHAGKARLAPDSHPAGTAHTRSIDHQRIEADDRFDPVFERRLRDEFHHNHRTDGDHLVVMLALIVDQIAQQSRHQSFIPRAAVIRGDINVSGHGFHLVDENQRILVFRPDNHIGFDTMLGEPLHLRINRCGTYSARHEQDTLAA